MQESPNVGAQESRFEMAELTLSIPFLLSEDVAFGRTAGLPLVAGSTEWEVGIFSRRHTCCISDDARTAQMILMIEPHGQRRVRRFQVQWHRSLSEDGVVRGEGWREVGESDHGSREFRLP